jgi:hypothetical protein
VDTEISTSQKGIKRTTENQLKFLEEYQNTQEKFQAVVWNNIYRVSASDSTFNAFDDTGKCMSHLNVPELTIWTQ